MKICGVDDAGRGSMIGPMVIAGISIEKKNIPKLRKLGVRDSKKLSPKKRELMYKEIVKLVDDYHVIRIPPRTIDKYVFEHNLNHLEAKKMALKGHRYIDNCKIFNSIEQAIFDCNLVLATCGRIDLSNDIECESPEDISEWIASFLEINNLGKLTTYISFCPSPKSAQVHVKSCPISSRLIAILNECRHNGIIHIRPSQAVGSPGKILLYQLVVNGGYIQAH